MTNRYRCALCHMASYSSSEDPGQVCAWCRRAQAHERHIVQALDLVAPTVKGGHVSPDRLKDIEARAEAATEGPWERGDVWQWGGVVPEMFGDAIYGSDS